MSFATGEKGVNEKMRLVAGVATKPSEVRTRAPTCMPDSP